MACGRPADAVPRAARLAFRREGKVRGVSKFGTDPSRLSRLMNTVHGDGLFRTRDLRPATMFCKAPGLGNTQGNRVEISS